MGCSVKKKNQRNGGQPQKHAAKPEKPDLPIAHFEDLLKQPAPSAWRQERQHAFKHQHESQRQPKAVAIHGELLLLAGGRSCA